VADEELRLRWKKPPGEEGEIEEGLRDARSKDADQMAL